MPLITIEAADLTPEQKLELIQKIPTEASKIMNVPIDEFRTFIREYSSDNIGIGNVTLTEVFNARKKQ